MSEHVCRSSLRAGLSWVVLPVTTHSLHNETQTPVKGHVSDRHDMDDVTIPSLVPTLRHTRDTDTERC